MTDAGLFLFVSHKIFVKHDIEMLIYYIILFDSEKRGGLLDEHKVSLPELFAALDSSKNGLTQKEAENRQKSMGFNELEKKKKTPAIVRFAKHLVNFFALLLWAGAILAFTSEYLSPGEGNLYIGIALSVVVLLNSVFTFYQESKAEEAMAAFMNMMPTKAIVLRDGRKMELEARYLVPGDIIFLEEGMKVPADARLIEQYALKVDNSALTGESEPQLRSLECTNDNILESRNMLFSGTTVQTGSGKAIVFGTGMNTQIGKLANLTDTIALPPTPIHKEIQHFIKIISIIAITLGAVFFMIGFAFDNNLFRNMLFAIGIIVANVPEGLLPTVTLALSIAARKMAKKNALVKNLESVETLGSTTVICTDKTGTLTLNQMRVNSVYLGHGMVDKDFKEYHEDDHHDFDTFLHAEVLCNNSSLSGDGYIGDPTEGSLLMHASGFINIDKLKEIVPRVHEIPFDSNTKRMVTVNRYKSGHMAYMKGAPEVVLAKCSHVLINGRKIRMTKKKNKEIQKTYERFSKNGERVLGFGYKHFKGGYAEEDLDGGFVFIALAGMVDPPRPEVAEAISKCHTAGIKVFMVTGDHALTAEAIAKDIGLITGRDTRIITGAELRRMEHDELLEVLKSKEIVFARTSPEQKLRVVRGLQDLGEVVAVTGDGVNDAPALKNADIGVAMGKVGTDVAKEAADMILMDDNFATIVNAVEEGRTIFDNIKKFMAYILTSNMPEILPFIAFVLIGIPLPLTVILILAVDLGTDLIPALGLAAEKPESDIMRRPPRSRKERLFTGHLLFMSYGIIGMIQAAAGFFSYFYVIMVYHGLSWDELLRLTPADPVYMQATTAFFVSIIIVQIADVLICRQRRQSIFQKGIFSNKVILLGIASELLLGFIIVYTPVANTIMNTHPIPLKIFFLAWPFALAIFIFDETRRWLIRRGNKFVKKYINY